MVAMIRAGIRPPGSIRSSVIAISVTLIPTCVWAADPLCTLTGHVSGAGLALPGVSIVITSGEAVQKATSTAIDGTYKVSVPPGTYDVAVELTGFDPVARKLSFTSTACAQTLDLTMTIAPRGARHTPPSADHPGHPRGAGQAATERDGASSNDRPAGPARGSESAGTQRSGGGRFQPLAVRASVLANAADENVSDAGSSPLLLPPGFGDEAGADAIAINGNDTRVDRGQLNDRLGALARGEFVLGGPNGPPAAFGQGPAGPGGFGGPLGSGGPGGFPGGGPPGGPGAFFLAGRRGQQQRVTTNLDYTFGGSPLNAPPFQLRSNDPTTVKPYTQNNFSMNSGGPLKIPHIYDGTNRTSFNFGYSGQRGNALFDQYSTVPTLAMRAGDFSSIAGQLVDPMTGLPFASNQITASRISPQALALLRFIPLPNLGGATSNYHYSTVTGSSNDAINLRITHNFTPNVPGPGGRFGGRGGFGAGGQGGLRQQQSQQAQTRRGTSVSLTAQFQYKRSDADQANVFSTLGGATHGSSLAVPVSLNIARGRDQHVVNVQFSRTMSQTTNLFAGIQNVTGEAGILGAGTDPFSWGVPSLSFSSITGLHDITPSERDDDRVTASYTWTHPISRHLFHIGGDIRFDRSSSHTDANADGSFLFTGLYSAAGVPGIIGSDFADFLLGMPQQASVQYGPGTVSFTGRATSFFVQDEWRARPDLTVNLGFRYELLWPFTEQDGHMVNLDVTPNFTAAAPVVAGGIGPYTGAFPVGLLRTDTNNFAPRIGIAWRRPNRVIFRVGYGVSYNSGSYAAIARNLASQPPFAVTNTNIGALNRALLLEDALEGGETGFTTTNNYGVDKDYALGRVQTLNTDVAWPFRQVWLVSGGYTRTIGSGLDIVRAPNRDPSGLRIDTVQPFLWQTSEGSSVLDAATIRLQRRAVHGIGGGVSYTLAKSRDNAPSIGGSGGSTVVAQDDQDLNAEWGLSNFDRRHRFQGNFQFDLPFGTNRRWLNSGGRWATLLGNWRATATFTAQSGTPLTARVQGAATDVASGVNGALRANFLGGPIAVASPTVDEFFNTEAFAAPAPGQFGTSPRNIIIGPGSRQLDAVFSRDIRLNDTRALTLTLRASNLLNLVNYAVIDTSVTSPTFGHVLSVQPMRSLQVNLHFRF
jgi:hypothetical protein